MVLNRQSVVNDDGETESVPYTPEEIERYSELVRKAVGFEEARGDAVSVVGTNFRARADLEETDLPEPSFFDRFDWLGALRVIAALVAIILLIFLIIRPTMRQLLTVPRQTQMLPAASARELPSAADSQEENATALAASAASRRAEAQDLPSQEYEQRVSNAKNIVNQDPKRVAQVVRDWVNEGA